MESGDLLDDAKHVRSVLDVLGGTNQSTSVITGVGPGVVIACLFFCAICAACLMISISIFWAASHSHSNDIISYERAIESMTDELSNREIRIRKLQEQLEE